MSKKEYIFEPNFYPLKKGIQLIEASAGTGKTFSITHLLVRLITEEEIPIEKILIVSFTNATASELKSRVDNRLHDAIKILSLKEQHKVDNLNFDPLLQEWAKSATNSEEETKWRFLLINALNDIDKADITTIHGFCQRTISRYATGIKCIANSKLVTEDKNYSIIEEITNKYWQEQILKLDPLDLKGLLNAGLKLENLINYTYLIESNPSLELDNSLIKESLLPNNLYELLDMSQQENWSNFIYYWTKNGLIYDEEIKLFAQDLKDQGSTSNEIRPYSASPKKDRHLLITEWIAKFKNDYSTKANRPNYMDVRTQKEISEYYNPSKLNQISRKYCVKYSSKIDKSLMRAISFLYNSPIEIVIIHSTKTILGQLQDYKSKHCLISYSDQLKALDPSPNYIRNKSNNISTQLRFQYKVAIVDEFQDTDKIQWRILNETFGKSKDHLLILVGDPKQAIYNFRGGDIHTYMKARNQAERIDILTTNYRATKNLMNATNRLFKEGLIRSKLTVKNLDTPNLRIINKSDKKEPAIEILYLVSDINKSNKGEVESKSTSQEKIPFIVSKKILELINCSTKKTIELKDICILVQSNYQASLISQELNKSNLPNRLSNNLCIFHTEGSRYLQIIINCISEPSNFNNLSLLKLSCLVNDNNENIKEQLNEEKIDILNKEFTYLKKNFNKLGLRGSLTYLIKNKIIDIISIDNNTVKEINQCAENIEGLCITKNKSPKSISTLLKDMRYKEYAKIPAEFKINSDTSNNSISILTIHKSKGLEYKTIICPYLWQKPPTPKGPLWRSRDNKKWIINIDTHSIYTCNLARENEDETTEEAERLAYVALTRAKEKLIILWFSAKGQEGNPLKTLLFGKKNINTREDLLNYDEMKNYLDGKNIKTYEAILHKKALSPYKKKKEEHEILNTAKIPEHSINTSWGRYSYSSWINTIKKHDLGEEILESQSEDYRLKNKYISNLDQNIQTIYPLNNYPRGRIAGTCMHQILEKIDFKMPRDTTLKIIRKELAIFNFDSIPNLDNQIFDSLNRLFNRPLGEDLDNIKLNEIKNSLLIKELKFDISISQDSKCVTTNELLKVLKNYKNRYGEEYIQNLSNLNINSRGYLTGAIDLVFVDNKNLDIGKWWVVDWKTNYLHSEDDINNSYDQVAMQREMIKHHYPLQAYIYLVALNRYLKWKLNNYIPSKHLGGYIYCFIRGITETKEFTTKESLNNGIITEKVNYKFILELDNILSK